MGKHSLRPVPRPRGRRHLRFLAAVLGCVVLLTAGYLVLPTSWTAGADTTVVTWADAPQPALPDSPEASGFTDSTLRTLVRVSAGGDALRLRLDNSYGSRPLTVDRTTVALAAGRHGPAVSARTLVPLTVDGRPSATIPVGRSVLTDPVRFRFTAAADLVVSLHLPGPTGALSSHGISGEPTEVGPGDLTGSVNGRGFTAALSARPVLTGVLAGGGSAHGTVVVLGGSMTDGLRADLGDSRRWPDLLADRLSAAGSGLAMANAGISGNRLLIDHPLGGTKTVDRFGRDVLDQQGARSLIIEAGINDIQQLPHQTDPSVVAGALEALADRAHQRGIRVLVGTLSPFRGWPTWSPELDRVRLSVNQRLQHSRHFDGVIDYDAVLRDPAAPSRIRPELDSGDGLHPNDDGYTLMAQAVPLDALEPAAP